MVIPRGVDTNETMFEFSPFDLNKFTKACQEVFGITVIPRPGWAPVQYGGRVSSSIFLPLSKRNVEFQQNFLLIYMKTCNHLCSD